LKRLHIHSDNSEWAGSENMPGIMLTNEKIYDNYLVSFSYRDSPEYCEGFSKWVKPFSHRQWADIYPMDFWVTNLYKLRKYYKPIMGLKYFAMIEEVIKLYNLFSDIKPDVLHINNGGFPAATSCNSAAIAGKLLGVPVITYTINSAVRASFVDKVLASIVKKCVTFFISASKHLKQTSETLKEDGNWIVIPNTLRYEEPRVSPDQIREKLGIDPEKTFFLNVGVMEPRKSQHLLPKLLNGKKSFIVIKGEDKGNLINIKKKIIEEDGNGEFKILLKSEFTDRELISACDYFVLPSESDEDFPNVLLLAMMYGKPSIANDLAGIPEIINKEILGSIFDYRGSSFTHFSLKLMSMIDYNEGSFNLKGTETNRKEHHSKEIKEIYQERYGEDIVIDRFLKTWSLSDDLF